MLKTNKNQTKKMPEGALGHCGPRGGLFFGAPDLSCLCVSEASRAPFPHLIVVSATYVGHPKCEGGPIQPKNPHTTKTHGFEGRLF